MDPATAAMIAKAGVDIVSGFTAKKGQDAANSSQMDFNSEEAQKNRDFQERMFSTRYQMTRRDLEAAGYNPLLGIGSPMGTPSGASAHAEPKSSTGEMSQIFSRTAKEVSEMALTAALTRKTKSEASIADSHARTAALDADAYSNIPYLPQIKAILSSLGGAGGLVGGVGVGLGQLFKGVNSAKAFRSMDSFDSDGFIIPRRGRDRRY